MIGKTIGKYRIIERLGRGGMGTVYKAVDETLDREVAVKVLNPELTDSEVMKRFRAEATTLARLNHPEIATIHEIFRSDDDLLMVMELVRGETLDHLALRCGPLPPERAAYLVAQVLGALEHAHLAGVVHRDLKPANVMVTDQGGVKIMDFGIARVAGAEHITSDGHMMGTPAYMAPEQVVAQEVDARADLYSAGVVFYRLLTGSLPFQADTAIGMVQKQLSDQPTPAHMYRADLPDWCDAILTRALQKSPVDRFQTAEEFRAILLEQLGAAATERTGAFAAAHGATPQSIPVSAVMTVGSRQSAVGSLQSAVGSPQSAVGGLTVGSRQSAVGSPQSAVGGTQWAVGGPPTPAAVQSVNPQTESATVVLQRRHFAVAGGLLAIVALGVVVLAVVALRRQNPAAPVPGAAADTVAAAPASPTPESTAPASSTTESATPASTTPASTTPAQTTPASTTPAPAAPASATPPAPVSVSATPPATTAAAKPTAPIAGSNPPATEKTPAVAVASATPPALAPPAKDDAIAEAIPAHPPFVFEAKAVVAEAGKNRERDATVVLTDGKVTVTEKNDRVIATLPFSAVVGISISNSKQPMWTSPQGPAEMMRVEGGAFGFLKGGRNWVGVRTQDTSLVLRVDDENLRKVIKAIEERTGKKVERVVERKN